MSTKQANERVNPLLFPLSARRIVGWVLAIVWITGNPVAEERLMASPPHFVAAFFQSYCLDCHEGLDSEGGADLSMAAWDLESDANFAMWVNVYDRVTLGKMPPEDADQPSDKVRSEFGKSLGQSLYNQNRVEQEQSGRTRLRRLNRTEYENTVHDLLGIDVPLKHFFPEETPAGGYDTVSSGLRISPAQIDQYLLSADLAIDEAIRLTVNPKVIKERWSFHDEADVRKNLDRAHGAIDEASGVKHRHLFRQLDDAIVFISPGASINTLKQFRPLSSGVYRVRISAYSHNSDAPVSMMVFTSDWKTRQLVRHFEMPAGKPRVVELEVRMTIKEILQLSAFNVGYNTEGKTLWNLDRLEDLDAPGLAVQWVEVEGPLVGQWPPSSVSRLFGDDMIRPMDQKGAWTPEGHVAYELAPEDATLAIEQVIHRFATRAFRRPLELEEVAPYVKLAIEELDSGRDFQSAIRVALRAVLVSPRFLILEESPGKLDDFALASRLSYFLWTSMPDDELLELAAKGQLGQAEILGQQVRRMIESPRSHQFVKNFAGQWLDLRSIDATTPDTKLYPEYDAILNASMVAETESFFTELLQRNLPIRNIIDSNFLMLNRRMAAHYEIDLPGPVSSPDESRSSYGESFRKVTLGESNPRGGLLTQASVLKVTANGTVTSPVRRGAWVQRRILGQPPPPPPPVDAIEPDTRGTTTIREQLAKHRSSSACASCHQHIDPPGFALESFDVIGGYRKRYRSDGEGDSTRIWVYERPFQTRFGLNVDSRGILADGQAFDGIQQFKTLLLQKEDEICINLAENLVTYSTGSEVRFSDRFEVKKITDRVKANGGGLKTLIIAITQSDLFRHK